MNEQITKIERAFDHWRELGQLTAEVGWLEGTAPDVLERVWRLETRWLGGGPPHWYRDTGVAEYESWAILRRTYLAALDPSSGHYFPQVLTHFYNQGLRGKPLLETVANYYADLLKANLEAVTSPPLKEITVEKKRLEGAPRPEKVWYEWGVAKENISSRVV